MKNLTHKIDFWNLFIGVVVGIGVGVYIVNAFVPNANQLIAMYQLGKPHEVATSTQVVTHTSTSVSSNPYMMAKITSEKQFLQQMKLHHEAAVLMAQQMLALKPRADIASLAKNIISTQTTEIKIMKDWLVALK